MTDAATAKVDAVIAAHGVREGFSADIEAQVAAIEASPGLDDGVEDLRALPFVTIDNEDSRDLDQALFLEADDAGATVWYALADASYYVRPDTPLYDEAVRRGASYYLPTRAVPMLPRALSEGLVSLNPAVDRRALVFETRLGPDGHTQRTRVHRARIRSRAKLSYNGVQAMFSAEAGERDAARAALPDGEDGARVWRSLQTLRDVGEARIRIARERDVVSYDRKESRVSVDGGRLVAGVRSRNDVERWNEQISLLCNIEGARLLVNGGRYDPELHSVFRVHLPPRRERLEKLEAVLGGIAEAHGLGDDWRWRGPGREPLADFLDRVPRDPPRLRAAVARQVLYSNRASEFSAEPGRHHALGVDAYARFSAPMREIVGIFTHKELLESMDLIPARDRDADEALRQEIIAASNEAKRVQKQLDKAVDLLVIEQLLRDDLSRPLAERPRRTGTVIGLRRDKVYVALDGFALDLKVYLEDLDARVDGTHRTEAAVLLGPDDAVLARIGDAVDVHVLDWDAGRSRFVLGCDWAACP